MNSPKQTLKQRVNDFLHLIRCRKTPSMFHFPHADIKAKTSWYLDAVYERTLAAHTLGHEVILVADSTGLTIKYRERIEIPYKL